MASNVDFKINISFVIQNLRLVQATCTAENMVLVGESLKFVMWPRK
jgi:ABC-type sugar transport system ATPase subunit